jgi:hypothetical protein
MAIILFLGWWIFGSAKSRNLRAVRVGVVCFRLSAFGLLFLSILYKKILKSERSTHRDS